MVGLGILVFSGWDALPGSNLGAGKVRSMSSIRFGFVRSQLLCSEQKMDIRHNGKWVQLQGEQINITSVVSNKIH
ncbi:hypothetical protein ZEAMMB73_Zm00001d012232 [Zea mays]|uniref:Uncharacterized protein n=1 Tax=Zea mays TaxID=4577 RepID=A0A1D6G7L8_MAIZE|nr:hypothetical protein ZEAMMB73_Zm00001d012232 [Zea mays]AQK99149.1 hypothetical protein ZEAMMB73_Zm00001d012232 [Zea mays]